MKKIGLLSLALVLALGALGVGYAMWSDTLVIDGTINTGNVEVIFASQYDNDKGAQDDPCEAGEWVFPEGAAPEWVGGRYDKHVANTFSTFEGYNPPNEDGNYATITVNEAYPSYWASVMWDIKNVGSIPVKFWSATLTEISKGDNQYAVNETLKIGKRYYVDADTQTVDRTLDAGDDFSFILSCDFCDQIDAYEANQDIGYVDVTVHLEQDAEQKTKYDFTIGFVFAQWNEGLPCQQPA